MDHVLNMLEPSTVTINGTTFPLLFNMRAAASMERELDTPYPAIIKEIAGVEDEDGNPGKPMSWNRQAVVIACMIRAGGVEITADQLMDCVHMTEAQELANAAMDEMLHKQPKGKEKAEKNG